MNTSQDIRTTLLTNVNELATLEGELNSARTAADDAHSVVVAATIAYDVAKIRVQELELRIDALSKITQRIQQSLSTLSSFPVELLSLIFSWANTDAEHDESEEQELQPRAIDVSRMKLPWRLGAVCKRWRAVVLRTAASWSYVGIPEDAELRVRDLPDFVFRSKHSGFFPHLDLLLRRSRLAPLDVVVCVGYPTAGAFGDESRYDRDSLEESQFFHALMTRLSSHLCRFRMLHVDAQHHLVMRLSKYRELWSPHFKLTLRQMFVDFLRAPTPRLVDLRLRFNYADDPIDPNLPFWHGFPDSPRLPLLLPDAPNLRFLSVSYLPLVCREDHPGLPSLQCLRLTQNGMHGVLLADILWSAPALRELAVAIRVDLPHPGLSSQFPVLDAVRSIILEGSDVFGLLEEGADFFPNLESLSICDLAEFSVTPSLAQRLKTLRITGVDDMETHVPRLRALESLDEVELSRCSMRDDVFFGAMCDEPDPMWPRLRALKMWRVEMNTVDKDGVLQMMRKRNSPRNRARWESLQPRAEAFPRPIALLQCDATSVPTWILVQIRALYPPPENAPLLDDEFC